MNVHTGLSWFMFVTSKNMLVKLVKKSDGNTITPASITLHKLLFFIGNMTLAKH